MALLTETVLVKASVIDDVAVVFKDALNQESVVYISALIGLTVAISLFYKNVLVIIYNNWLYPMYKFFKTIAELPDKLENVNSSLVSIQEKIKENSEHNKKILGEFSTNGGSSLRDAIDKIQDSISSVDSRLWALISGFKDPTWESDINGNCIKANPALLSLTQRSLDEMLGNGWINTIAEEDKDRVFKEWIASMNQKRQFEMVYTIINKNHEKFKVTATAIPFYNKKGLMSGYIGHYSHVEKNIT